MPRILTTTEMNELLVTATREKMESMRQQQQLQQQAQGGLPPAAIPLVPYYQPQQSSAGGSAYSREVSHIPAGQQGGYWSFPPHDALYQQHGQTQGVGMAQAQATQYQALYQPAGVQGPAYYQSQMVAHGHTDADYRRAYGGYRPPLEQRPEGVGHEQALTHDQQRELEYLRTKVQAYELEAQWQVRAQGGIPPGVETGPQGGPPGPQAPVVEFPDDHSVSQASEAVYPGDAASVEAKTLWKQSQIRERPPSELTRVGIELTIPDHQVGVPPRWGSYAYDAQYEFLHSKGFSKEKIIAE
ncbi:MAG: hypothetical protein GY820_24370, partial [Gammaproteobacteria bacterium]|nr:hypothetical protein [Gammaproteobacteria bacterium]